jgi:hypothetical protein
LKKDDQFAEAKIKVKPSTPTLTNRVGANDSNPKKEFEDLLVTT